MVDNIQKGLHQALEAKEHEHEINVKEKGRNVEIIKIYELE